MLNFDLKNIYVIVIEDTQISEITQFADLFLNN